MSDNSNLQSPQLPPTWTMTTLGAVVAYGRTNKAEPSEMKGTDWVLELEDIEKDSSRLLGRLTFADRQSKSTKNRFEAGDVLYGKLRPYLNKVLIADQPGFCTTEIVPIQPGEHLDARYLFYWLKHPVFLKYVEAESHGMNMPRLGTDAGRAAPFVLAPRAEQTRIADQLDTLLARVNACNDHLDAIPGILKRFRQSVLTAALTRDILDKFDGLSAKATRKTAKISDIASVGTGSTPLRSNSAFYASAGTPWVTSAATGSPLVVDADQFVTDAAIAAHRLKVYPKGTLLVAMYGEGKTRGQVSELAIDATINQACAAISVDETLATRQFVKLALTANYLVMRELAEGGNQPNLNLSKIKEFEIPLPALDEQARIVGEVEGLLKLAYRVEARYTAMRAHAQRLAPQVLAKAFRGELVEQDPQDEPASVLLQRLAANALAKAPSSRGMPRAQPQVPATLPAPQAPAPIDWHTLPNNDWAAPAATQDQAITACLTAVLKAWGQPMPELEARLATLLCQQPCVLTTVLSAAQAKQWVRLVGEEAKPLPAQVTRLQPASNSPWGQAIKRMRARGDLVEAGSADDTTWSLGPGASAIITAGWPDGRAAFVVAHLRAHGVASILPALAPADQAFVHVRAA